MDWRFNRSSNPMGLGQSSQYIKTWGKNNSMKPERNGRIWKLEPMDAGAGFLFVYTSAKVRNTHAATRFVPRWVDLNKALELDPMDADDNFSSMSANSIKSVYLIPDITSRIESDPGFAFDGNEVRVYFHPKEDWKITEEWVPKTEEDSWMGHQDNQYLRQIMDDYEKVGNITPAGNVAPPGERPGAPSAWVWNERSPRRWNNINIGGDDWVVTLDEEGTRRMNKNLSNYEFHAAINRKAYPN
jgi:hypothetical protein